MMVKFYYCCMFFQIPLAKSYDLTSILFNKSCIFLAEALMFLLAEPFINKASAVFFPADLIAEIALSIFLSPDLTGSISSTVNFSPLIIIW